MPVQPAFRRKAVKRMLKKKYNVGLDISITGIGWCVTDTDGRVLRKGNRHLYGISMFEEAKTAKERRQNRSTRRRTERKKRRIDTLQQLMAEDVLAADDAFYIRLDETAFRPGDRSLPHLYKTLPEFLFTDGTVRVRRDGNGAQNLPIYEIREELICQKKQADIRYVYLALAHILKSRGHFLDRISFSAVKTQEDAVRYLQSVIGTLNARGNHHIPDDIPTVREFCGILEREPDGEQVASLAGDLFNADQHTDPLIRAMAEALCGGEIQLSSLLPGTAGKVSFEKLEDLTALDDLDEEAAEILQTMGEICAWRDRTVKEGPENESLSAEMNRRYAAHKEDLRLLKSWIKRYTDAESYRKMFHDDREAQNYNAYAHSRSNPKAFEGASWHWCSQENLYEKIRETILACQDPEGLETGQEIISRMFDENGSVRPNGFLPLQRIRYNAEISNSRQMKDLLAILENQAEYYPSLKRNKGKIAEICGFILPGYVGPLRQNENSPFKPWIRYRAAGSGPVMPWDFQERVDLDATAEAYMEGLTNHCTFLPDEKVLPRRSLLYEEYMVLDELNRIRVHFVQEETKDGKTRQVTHNDLIRVKYKKRLIDEVFAKYRHVTGDLILRWLEKNSEYAGKEDLYVVSANGTEKRRFTASLASRIELERIFGRRITEEDQLYGDLEKIILWSTVFRDRDMYRRKLHQEYDGKINETALRQLESFRCTGWGKFSRQLLTAEVCRFREEKKSLIYVMRETNDNFMRIYHNRKYKTQQGLKKLLTKEKPGKITYEMVLRMPCSPSVKRGIWHAVRVLDEIRGYMGGDPAGIYIRNLRESNARRRSVKVRNRTRFEQVRKLYDAYEAETGEKIAPVLRSVLQKTRNGMSDEEYLYLTQMGKCMYTGKPLDLSVPGSCMVDYIIPQCLLADDSLDNRVLIRTEANRRESKQAMPLETIRMMEPFWTRLNASGFITGNKRRKLTTAEYDDTQLHIYLNSQWTETSLTILRLTDMLKKYYQKSHVYGINARLTDQLRKKSDLYFIRELNDFQSAYDAFLTAHIGGFADRYLPKVTSEGSYTRILLRLWEKTGKSDKNGMILAMYDQDQPEEELPGGAWKGAEERRQYLEKVYSWHDGFTSFLPTEFRGKFYRETVYRPGFTARFPVKDRMEPDVYGGYALASTGHMAVIGYLKQGKETRELINVPVHIALRNDPDYLMAYLRKTLGFSPEKGYGELRVLRDHIGLHQEILFDGHLYYMRSAIEAVNAKQLFVPAKYIRTVWQAVSIPPEELETMEENGKVHTELFRYAASFLAQKMIREFDIYPKLVKSLRESADRIGELKIADLARLIHALIVSMNTRGVRIAPIIRDMTEKMLQGDTRISNKRITGDEIILINRSVTGIYSKKIRI